MTDLTPNKNAAVTNSTMEFPLSTKVRPEMGSTVTAELYRNLCDVISEARRSPPVSVSASVCYVIVSTSSMLWTTLTLVATGLISIGLITPYWLITPPGRRSRFPSAAVTTNRSNHVGTVSIGVFNECTGQRKPEVADIFGVFTDSGGGTSGECGTFVSGFDMPDDTFPDAWKSALILLTGATMLMTFTDFSALISICVQSIFGKSIFTVTGLLQSIAGIICQRLLCLYNV